jgi:hypothetical protein
VNECLLHKEGEIIGNTDALTSQFHHLTSVCTTPYPQVAPVVKERMMKKGSMMVGYQPHGDKANFFRQIIISPQVSREDMDFLLDQIHSLGMDL